MLFGKIANLKTKKTALAAATMQRSPTQRIKQLSPNHSFSFGNIAK